MQMQQENRRTTTTTTECTLNALNQLVVDVVETLKRIKQSHIIESLQLGVRTVSIGSIK